MNNRQYKNVILTCLIFITNFSVLTVFSQTPGGINYQGVAQRSTWPFPVNSQLITLKFTIREKTPNGAAVYNEVRNTTTDSFGVFSLVIGAPGAVSQSGDIRRVHWSDTTSKFLQVELNVYDPVAPGFVNMGTTQLLSVPFSFYSDISDSAKFSNGSGKYFFSATKPNGSEPIPHDPNEDYNYVLKFPTVVINEGNAYNPVTSSYTAPDSGIYNFNLTLNQFYNYTRIIDSLTSFADISLIIVKNNRAIKYFPRPGDLNVNDFTYSHSFQVKLAKNDVVSVRLSGYCNSGSNCTNLMLVTSTPTAFADPTAFVEFSGYKIK